MLLFVYVMLQVTVSSPVSSLGQCPSMTPLAKNINDFGFQLSRKLDQTGNQFISPFSIYSVIVMVYRGAKHNTAKEIENALHLRRDGLIGSKLQNSFKALLRNYLGNGRVRYTLETANGIFVQRGFPVKERFVNDLKAFNDATVKQVDFAHDGQAAKKEINEWVSENTKGKINEILSDTPDHLTKIMLINAVYFKGTWKIPFIKKSTLDRVFFKTGGEKKTVKMMIPMINTNSTFLFHEDHKTGYKYLELPYKGDDIVMLLALPREGDFPFKHLSSSELCDAFAKLENKKMEIILIPKFKFEFFKELKKSLIALGIRDLFSSSADLTGISARPSR